MLKSFKTKTSYTKYFLSYLLVCLFFFILMELIHRANIESLLDFFSSKNMFTIFYLILFFTFTSLYVFIFENPIIFCVIHYSVWCFLSFISNINSFFKASPLMFEDLFLFNEATNIVSKYLNKTLLINVLLITICITLVLIITFKHFYNYNVKIFKLKNKSLNFILKIISLLFFLIIKNNLFYYGESLTYTVSDFDLTQTYSENGFLYSFYKSTYLFTSNNNSDYDKDVICFLKNKIKQDKIQNNNLNENIILIQLESFFDPIKLKNISLSDDPLKNFRNLTKNNLGGELIVPVIGGGTTQTEFEILTGINIKSLHTKMPYLNLLNRNKIESLANIFNNSGFYTTAIHNYFSTFYDRKTAYEKLGFQNFIPLESISSRERSENHWYKDSILIEEIKTKILSTKEKDFIFGVTVESHGPYNTKINGNIQVSSDVLTENEKIELQNYVNILQNVDNFILELVSSLNSINEDYTLILYSDHLPTLGENFNTFTKTLNEDDFFKTPYLIVSNENEKFSNLKNKTLYSYEFTSEILNSLNLPKTIYQNFRNIFRDDEKFKEYEKQLLLDITQKNIYENNVFPYETHKLKIGNIDPTINEIKIENGIAYIIGENFTPNIKVSVNKKIKKSTYVSKNVIKLLSYIPKKSDLFILTTFSNKNSPLNSNKHFEFQN